MTHLLFKPYKKLEQIFAWLPSCYFVFHKNVALKKVPYFSRVYQNTTLQDLGLSCTPSLQVCMTVILLLQALGD